MKTKIKKYMNKLDDEPVMLFFIVAFILGMGALAVASTQLLKVLSYFYIVFNMMIIFILGKDE